MNIIAACLRMNLSDAEALSSLAHANTTGKGCPPPITQIFGTAMSFLVSLPLNCYVAWVIIVDTEQTLVSCFFELNMSLCEALAGLLSPFNISTWCDYLNAQKALKHIRSFFYGLLLFGRPLLQTTVCVERYLAVVHPVVFLKFKALRYKVLCSSVVWLIILVCSLAFTIEGKRIALMFTIATLIIILVKLYCFLCALRVLREPQPGDGGRERERVSQAKIRAFKIILLLLLNTLVQYGPLSLIWILRSSLNESLTLAHEIGICIMISAGVIQPLLLLQRTGKLSSIRIP